MRPKIFLIHGLFMHGYMMQYMQRQLEQYGYEVLVFSYQSVRRDLSENAALLMQFVKENSRREETCHFVGHSLGGLLIRLGYEIAPDCFTGRIVTIGTPHQGSWVAERIAEDIHQEILGGSYACALDGDMPDWQGNVALGSIAGDRCIGIGMALKHLAKPNDGTVSVKETHLANQTDHIVIPLSHTALIYSKRVCYQVDAFLRTGQFEYD